MTSELSTEKVYKTCHSKPSGFRSHNEFKHQTKGLATGFLEDLAMDKVICEKALPASNVAISGRVKRIGSKKTSPQIAPIGIDKIVAAGTWTEGILTSSVMLASSTLVMCACQLKSFTTHPTICVRCMLPVKIDRHP